MSRTAALLLCTLLAASVASCTRNTEEPPPIDPEADPVAYLEQVTFEARIALFNWLLKVEADDLTRLVDGDKRLSPEAREDLIERSEKGAAAARAVIEKYPGRVEGHLYLASNLGLAGLARGHAQSLIDGLPGKVRNAYEKALEIDRTFDSAGPLRVKGKFQLGAPPPVGSRVEAGAALEEAARLAPVPENLLWLGDYRFKADDLPGAIEAWRDATTTASVSANWRIENRVRELARRRLALAEGSAAR